MPIYTCINCLQTVAKAGFEMVEHPLYSPDLYPTDQGLFPELEECRGKIFSSDDDMICAVNQYFAEVEQCFFQ